MLIDLLGILEDGSTPRAADLPRTSRFLLGPFPLGADIIIRLRLRRANGAPVTGASTTLSMKRRAFDVPALMQWTGVETTSAGPGRYLFTIASADTRTWRPGLYVYDVVAMISGKRDTVVPLSGVTWEPVATPIP